MTKNYSCMAEIKITCHACHVFLGKLIVDTADMPNDLQDKIGKIILSHREWCKYYSESEENHANG